MSASELLAMTASQAVAGIREGRVSAEVYIRTLLDRADQLSMLNSLIAVNSERALASARRIDSLRASGATLPALAGLPIVVKDNINTAELPTTGGTPALRNLQPTTNAPTLQRLLDAGAIMLGKANMHELAFGVTNTNTAPFAGPVQNPYDTTRVPGGSSGGTAAAIAAAIAPAGLGTDTGGSVRIPAAFCGLAGLRPSVGNGGAERRYDGAGVIPISHTRDTVGPMARTIEDVALLDAAISGTSMVTSLPLAGVRLGIARMFWNDVDQTVATVMQGALAKLQAAGVELIDVDTYDLAELTARAAFPIGTYEALDGIPRYLAATGVKNITLANIAAQVASPDVKGIVTDIARGLAAHEYEIAIKQHRPRMQAIYARCWTEQAVDALIFPTVILPPAPIDPLLGTAKVSLNGGPATDFFPLAIRNTDPGSTAGIPGITLPAGLTSAGLPVGLALDGPVGSDRKLLGLGLSIQLVLGPLPRPRLPPPRTR